MLGLEPARADAQLDPTAAHLVDLGDRDRQRAGQPEGGRRHQGAQADPAGLAGQPGQGHPRVGRPGQAVPAHRQVVVGPEEGVEAGLLGAPGDGEQVVVGGAHLGLGEDPQLHGPTLTSRRCRAAARSRSGCARPTGPGRMIARRSTRRCSSCSARRRAVRSSAPSSRRASPTSGWRPPRPAASRPSSSAPGSRPLARQPAPKLDAAQKAVAPKVAAAVRRRGTRGRGGPRRHRAPGGGGPRGRSRPRVEAAVARPQQPPLDAGPRTPRPRAAADLAPRVEAAQKAAQKALKEDVVPRLEAAQVAARRLRDPEGGRRPRGGDARRWRAPGRPWSAGVDSARSELDARRAELVRRRPRSRPARPASRPRRRARPRSRSAASSRRRPRPPPSRSSATVGKEPKPRRWPWLLAVAAVAAGGRRRCRRKKPETTGPRPRPATAPCPSYREDPVPSDPQHVRQDRLRRRDGARRRHSRRHRPRRRRPRSWPRATKRRPTAPATPVRRPGAGRRQGLIAPPVRTTPPLRCSGGVVRRRVPWRS